MLIIDEAQTIEGERGYLMELLIMKLRLLNPSIQIVFLSATLPCPTQLAQWINAELFVYEDRLSQHLSQRNNLVEYKVDRGKVCTLDGTLVHDFQVTDRGAVLTQLIPWIYQSMKESTTILVFCPTKSRCEDVVKALLSNIVSVSVLCVISRPYRKTRKLRLRIVFWRFIVIIWSDWTLPFVRIFGMACVFITQD